MHNKNKTICHALRSISKPLSTIKHVYQALRLDSDSKYFFRFYLILWCVNLLFTTSSINKLLLSLCQSCYNHVYTKCSIIKFKGKHTHIYEFDQINAMVSKFVHKPIQYKLKGSVQQCVDLAWFAKMYGKVPSINLSILYT